MEKSKEFLDLCEKYDVDGDEIPEIKSFEEACKALSLDPQKVLPNVSSMPAKHQESITAHCQMVIIAEAINEGKQPNWNNDDEYKYYPWFSVLADKKRPSGFGLSYGDCDHWDSDTAVGSRLCYASRDKAIYAGKHFVKLYEKLFLVL